jgi:uncharacterized protein (DUF1330 family)
MAKGYWIAHVDITDPDGYKDYVAANAEAFKKFGARFLVRGGAFESPEGTSRARNVILEFPTYEAALGCYRSLEYAKALSIRKATAVADVIIVEGYDGPQPGGS